MKCMICDGDNFKELFQKKGSPFLRCLNCGLTVAILPTQDRTRSELEEFYDKQASLSEEYLERVVSGQTQHKSIYQKQLKKIEQQKGVYNKKPKKGSLLDIGCSYGAFLKIAEERGWAVTGVEISQKESAYARDRLKLHVITGTLEKAYFPGDEFDVITMWHVIEHFTHPRQALIEINRVLKEDGLLVIETPNINSFIAKYYGKDWGWLSTPEHVYYFSPSTITELLNRTGFECLTIDTYESRIRGQAFYELGSLLHRALDIMRHITGRESVETKSNYQNSSLSKGTARKEKIYTIAYKALRGKNLFIFLYPILYWVWKSNYGAEMLVFASKRRTTVKNL